MWILFAAALAAAAYSVLEGGATQAGVFAAVLILAWFGLMDEERVQRLGNLVRLWMELPKLRRELQLSAMAAQRARPFLRLFVKRYPVCLRCPFRLDEGGQVRFARSTAERAISFAPREAPAMYRDLSAILAEEGVHFPDIRILWLLVNREVLDRARERVDREVMRGAGGDLGSVWRLFAQWERARTAEWGGLGLSLLHREALAEAVREKFGFAGMQGANNVTAWIDREIEGAHQQALLHRRKERLRADLYTDEDDVREAGQTHSLAQDLTIDRLADQAARDMAGAAQILAEVFAGQGADGRDQKERSVQGYFVAEHEGAPVVFQVGWTEQGAVPGAAVERALASKVRERASTSVLLALGRLEPDVLMLADEVGVLVLPSEALARMLDYHTDRMWRTVEWSLRASRPSNLEENCNQGLELGLST